MGQQALRLLRATRVAKGLSPREFVSEGGNLRRKGTSSHQVLKESFPEGKKLGTEYK